jgi:dihydrofolate synthase/folylpolyglutamate synthase
MSASDTPPPLAPYSDVVLERLSKLHPKLIDLSLDRVHRLLAALGHPEEHLPPVIHIAGTNGKGSALAFLKAMLEADGKAVHAYTSPHLVHFHERIYLGGKGGGTFIAEEALIEVLEECERANDGAPITYFEITTVAALLAFSRFPADALLLETGMGGRLDTTNVVARPAATLITPIGLDHQQFLGETLGEIAGEKAGIFRRDVPAIIGPQEEAALSVLLEKAERIGARPYIHGQDWMAFEEHGRLVYQDTDGLLDLPFPVLQGRHQLTNAGGAIAALRQAKGISVSDEAIEKGLLTAKWPARMQRLKEGPLLAALPEGAELWLDGGHNPAAGRTIAQAFAEMNDRAPRPLYLICGMLSTKDATGFLAAFKDLAAMAVAVPIEGEANALTPGELAAAAQKAGLHGEEAQSLAAAMTRIAKSAQDGKTAPRILICGSLYLAGQVLREHG